MRETSKSCEKENSANLSKELDSHNRHDEVVLCYQDGIQLLQLLQETSKGNKDEGQKRQLQDEIQKYESKVKELKSQEKQTRPKDEDVYHERIHIENGSKGNSYDKLFSQLFDNRVKSVEIDDPCIRSTHQIYNLLRFCEMVVKLKCRVTTITVTTMKDENPQQQEEKLRLVRQGLQKHGINLNIRYSPTFHEREIRLDTGVVIKIGRGLDFYQAANRFDVGYCDFDLRPCHETTIDIFHSKHSIKKMIRDFALVLWSAVIASVKRRISARGRKLICLIITILLILIAVGFAAMPGSPTSQSQESKVNGLAEANGAESIEDLVKTISELKNDITRLLSEEMNIKEELLSLKREVSQVKMKIAGHTTNGNFNRYVSKE